MAGLIEADYVVVGAGAMGMAFTDEILSHTDASVALLDRHARPGGHWNVAYPFVRLHQPSSFYGVNSAVLGEERLDQAGLNAGLAELASGPEVCAYFDQVMNRRFLASGRVSYHPSTEYADGVARSLPSGRTFEVRANRALVDATYMKVTVPSIRPPAYAVEPGVSLIPPNGLPAAARPEGGYVIVGAGKTAMDAVLWLLANHVEPDEITWITPRDSWLLNRMMTQPGENFRFPEQINVIAASASLDRLFLDLEETGHLARIDPSAEPTMYRCATVSPAELEQLRRVKDIVRMGRVKRITSSAVELDRGTLSRTPETLYVDCSADGLETRPVVPVFEEKKITLQTLRACQQVFSAALIGRIEALDDARDTKNELATVIPHPDTPRDFLSGTLAHVHNVGRWTQHPEIRSWLDDARLNPGTLAPPDLSVVFEAVAKLETFLPEMDERLRSADGDL